MRSCNCMHGATSPNKNVCVTSTLFPAASKGGKSVSYADVGELADQMGGMDVTDLYTAGKMFNDESKFKVKSPFDGNIVTCFLLMLPLLKTIVHDLSDVKNPKDCVFVITHCLAALLPDEIRIVVSDCGMFVYFFIRCPSSLAEIDYILQRLTYDVTRQVEGVFPVEETNEDGTPTGRVKQEKKLVPFVEKIRWFHPSHEVSTGLAIAASKAASSVFVMPIKMPFPVDIQMHSLHIPGANQTFKSSGMFNCHHPNWHNLSAEQQQKFEDCIGKNRFGYMVFKERAAKQIDASHRLEFLDNIDGASPNQNAPTSPDQVAQPFDAQGFEGGSAKKRPRT